MDVVTYTCWDLNLSMFVKGVIMIRCSIAPNQITTFELVFESEVINIWNSSRGNDLTKSNKELHNSKIYYPFHGMKYDTQKQIWASILQIINSWMFFVHGCYETLIHV